MGQQSLCHPPTSRSPAHISTLRSRSQKVGISLLPRPACRISIPAGELASSPNESHVPATPAPAETMQPLPEGLGRTLHPITPPGSDGANLPGICDRVPLTPVAKPGSVAFPLNSSMESQCINPFGIMIRYLRKANFINKRGLFSPPFRDLKAWHWHWY